jgi:sterol desaturase/sphingolipid hydroxylase (fatty acid hydroxylase superfamily)
VIVMVNSRTSLCRWNAREGTVCSRLCAAIDVLESYSKMTFPVENIVRILAINSGEATTTARRTKNWASELGGRYLRLSTYLVVSYLAYAYTWPIQEAHEWKWGWIMTVVIRNFAIEIVFYGGWHSFLYSLGYGQSKLRGKKFNKEDQYRAGSGHLQREQLYTTLGFCMSSAFEIATLHLWATKSRILVPFYDDFFALENLSRSVLHCLFVAYWRDFHFYWVHRMMHKWNVKLFGVDPGGFLYKHVHSLHHKSRNPGPWSGLSMHPIEHLFYYTCVLTPVVFTIHPFHFLLNKFHADISPVAGHDGYDQPAGGSKFHYLHHTLVDCNYGTPMVPMDVLFGSYINPETSVELSQRGGGGKQKGS